jgi:hypothetical protein
MFRENRLQPGKKTAAVVDQSPENIHETLRLMTDETGYSESGARLEQIAEEVAQKQVLLYNKEQQYEQLLAEFSTHPYDPEDELADSERSRLIILDQEIKDLGQEIQKLEAQAQKALNKHQLFTDVLLDTSPHVTKN